MDKIKLLQSRRKKVLEAGKDIRAVLSQLLDADSLVELSGFSFSKNEFYGEDAEGEGVVTGFGTVDGYPVYIAAQNFDVLSGGVSKENCEKILKCLALAEKNSTPVIYVLNSLGVQIGEGVTVLEGLAKVLSKAAKLHGVVPQFAIVNGEVYGQSALLAACADFTFFTKQGVLAADSPFVISAKSGANLPKEQVGGAKALNKANIVSFEADIAQARESVAKILAVLPDYSATVVDNGEDLNRCFPALNEKCSADDLIASVFDKDTALEIGKVCAPEARCVLGRVGGISVAAVVFDGGEEGVSLDETSLSKITSFAEFASYYSLPFVTFADTCGFKADLATANSLAMRGAFKLMETLDLIENAKIAVVYKKAIGLGYTLFAAKSMGYDYSYAFANAKIALFDSVQGAEIEFAGEKNADKAKLAEKYADENSDPVNAAKNGYIDNIIEPQFVRQYLIASLQMLLK